MKNPANIRAAEARRLGVSYWDLLRRQGLVARVKQQMNFSSRRERLAARNTGQQSISAE